tara:strand:+ start:1438 stop:1701 length:264 start_codon:yes stop_codon:yes gene_type:complete
MKKLIIVLMFTPIVSLSQSPKVDTTKIINSILDDIQDFKIYLDIDEALDLVEWRICNHYRFLLYTFEDRLLKLTNYDEGKNKRKKKK